MVTYTNNPHNNIVEVSIGGDIESADLDRAAMQMTTDFEKHGKLRILEDIQDLDDAEFALVWQDSRFGLKYLKDFTHVAIVADEKWLVVLAKASNVVIPAEVKTFEHSQIAEARTWLMTA